MKKISYLLSACIILGIIFYALTIISKDNQYTSVRKYLMPQIESSGATDENTLSGTGEIQDIEIHQDPVVIDTEPPVIEILNYKNGDIVTESTIQIAVQVSDNISPKDKISIKGNGSIVLQDGYNPIVVSATDEAGNVGATYIIIQKQ